MKTLLTSVAILLLAISAVVAQAGTDTTLMPTGCTPTNICYNVRNDAGLVIDYINYSEPHQRLTMSINGVGYDSGIGGAQTLYRVPMYSFDLVVRYYLTVSFSVVHKTCVRSGRVTVCPVFITLVGGVLELP